MNKLVRIVEGASVPIGFYSIGGARIVQPLSDEELGRELRTVEVRCHDASMAAAMAKIVNQTDGLELV